MRFIQTEHGPKAVGPYSQGTMVGVTLYVSGQIPMVPETLTLISEDIRKQTRQCLENVLYVVEAAGLSKNDIVKCVVFMTNIDDFAAMNEVYTEFFGDHKPARTTAGVVRMPRDVQIEIEAIAVRPVI